jgi:hypothetical protein
LADEIEEEFDGSKHCVQFEDNEYDAIRIAWIRIASRIFTMAEQAI